MIRGGGVAPTKYVSTHIQIIVGRIGRRFFSPHHDRQSSVCIPEAFIACCKRCWSICSTVLRGEFLQAILNTQPNTRLVRDARRNHCSAADSMGDDQPPRAARAGATSGSLHACSMSHTLRPCRAVCGAVSGIRKRTSGE